MLEKIGSSALGSTPASSIGRRASSVPPQSPGSVPRRPISFHKATRSPSATRASRLAHRVDLNRRRRRNAFPPLQLGHEPRGGQRGAALGRSPWGRRRASSEPPAPPPPRPPPPTGHCHQRLAGGHANRRTRVLSEDLDKIFYHLWVEATVHGASISLTPVPCPVGSALTAAPVDLGLADSALHEIHPRPLSRLILTVAGKAPIGSFAPSAVQAAPRAPRSTRARHRARPSSSRRADPQPHAAGGEHRGPRP